MTLARILSHWRLPPWRIRQRFPRSTLAAIQAAIAASEAQHRGELRFVVEGHLTLSQLLRGVSARQRALQLFARLGVGHTAEHSGILIYVLLAERRVEVVADRGITAAVPQAQWDALCAAMTDLFAAGRYQDGALAGIAGATRLLGAHFPVRGANPNELDDDPLLL